VTKGRYAPFVTAVRMLADLCAQDGTASSGVRFLARCDRCFINVTDNFGYQVEISQSRPPIPQG
jgi:hypothetical protein